MAKKKPGQPTKYKKEYCKALIEFFDIEPWYDKELEHFDKDGNVKWTDYKRMANPMPTIRKFSKHIGVAYQTIYEWLKNHEEFSDAFTHAKDLQKWFLIENGLNGCYNPAFSIFVAKNITDMRDVQEHEVEATITVDFIKNASNKQLSKIVKEGINSFGSEGTGKKGAGKKKSK